MNWKTVFQSILFFKIVINLFFTEPNYIIRFLPVKVPIVSKRSNRTKEMRHRIQMTK